MTTRINITVDQNGLLNQVANQTRANHEALVIQQEQKKVEDAAVAKLTEKRRSLGQDVKTGEPLPIATPTRSGYGDINGNNRIGQDPAANRQGDNDVFANFSARSIFPDDGIFMQVTSGDGLSVATVPWPGPPADFPDLLLPYPEGELRGEDPIGPGNALPLVYDDLGRLIGSVCGAFSCDARVYQPSYAYWSGSAVSGIGNAYNMSAFYDDDYNSSIHVLPLGRDVALVVFRVQILKKAITRVERVQRTVTIFERPDIEGGPYACTYDKSPASYKNATFYIEGVEEFHAFRVSASEARYLGPAPQDYVGKFKALPEYKAGTVADLTVTTARFSTYDNFLRGNDGVCAAGDQPVQQDIPWNASYASPNYDSILGLRGLAAYKLLGGNYVTPAVYSVFANPDFRETPGQAITDTYVKSYVPAFSGSLKWRTAENISAEELVEQTPYSFLGSPPESWDSSGPFSILSGFPDQWRKSGRKNSIPPDFTHTAWDWNKPSYCREQALALGFTEADLVP